MAIPQAAVWEVRPSVGSDTNGGGFTAGASGTDFSQQNAAQFAYTDLVAASGSTITSVGRPFTSVDPGNFIQITSGSGWTTGIYAILSVAAGVATMDRAIATGGSTGGTGNLGGALATASKVYSVVVSGNTIWGKATANYSVSTTQTLNQQFPLPVNFIGYTTTRGDGGRFTWTTATNSIHLVSPSSAYNYGFQNVNFSSTAGTPGDGFHCISGISALFRFVNCKLSGFNYGLNGRFSVDWAWATLLLENTEVTACVLDGVANDGQNTITGCYVHDNGGAGVIVESGGDPGAMFMTYTVIANNGGVGLSYAQATAPNSSATWPAVINCAIVNNTGDGVLVKGNNNTTPGSVLLRNCIIELNGGFGVNSNGTTGQGFISILNNAFRSNSSGNYNNLSGVGDVALTVDPFVNRAGGDYNLNGTAGGGAACKAAGFNSTILG